MLINIIMITMTDKEVAKIANDVKSRANLMISNKMPFSCYVSDVTLPTDKITEMFERLGKKELALKQLPQKALENMKKKGITPKMQAGEIVNIIIICDDDSVHISIYQPKNGTFDVNKAFEHVSSTVGLLNVNDTTAILKTEYPLKVRDDVQRAFFDHLRNIELYVDDESDDEMYVMD